MNSLLSAAIIVAVAIPALASETAPSTTGEVISTKQEAGTTSPQYCSPADSNLCPVCNGHNIIDAAGQEYTISCDYEIQGDSEDEVDGWASTSICMEACDENDRCFGINFAGNGSCSIVKGSLTGMTRRVGHTNMLQIMANSTTVTPSPLPVEVTSTVFGSSITASNTDIPTATSSGSVLGETGNEECDLELIDLCPKCHKTDVTGKGNKVYRIFCDSTLASSNATYSVQEFSSPESCLADCADFPLCKGAIFSDGRDCELAKGDDSHPVPGAGYTAFLPVTATTSAPTVPPPQMTTTSSDTLAAEATITILPIDPGCDLTALSCPACDGMPYVDQLNASYTVVCDFEPICDSVTTTRDGDLTQENCVQGCDQDVTCLAAMFYPNSGNCDLCQQGMDEGVGTNLPYIVLVADMDRNSHATSSSSLVVYPTTNSAATTLGTSLQSITDFPAPFPMNTANATANANAVAPVGPVLWTELGAGSQPRSSKTIASSNGTSMLGSIIHLTTTAVPTEATNIGAIACPALKDNVYIEPDSGNYFAVACDSLFIAARSHYISASDIAACAALCSGQCDGIQFGYTTRCGLYTAISIVQSGAGWTVGASITIPTTLTATPTAITTTHGPAGYITAVPTPQTGHAPAPKNKVR